MSNIEYYDIQYSAGRTISHYFEIPFDMDLTSNILFDSNLIDDRAIFRIWMSNGSNLVLN